MSRTREAEDRKATPFAAHQLSVTAFVEKRRPYSGPRPDRESQKHVEDDWADSSLCLAVSTRGGSVRRDHDGIPINMPPKTVGLLQQTLAGFQAETDQQTPTSAAYFNELRTQRMQQVEVQPSNVLAHLERNSTNTDSRQESLLTFLAAVAAC